VAPLTKANIHQHELIGLPASVVYSSNPSQVGISGRLVDESMNTITLSDGVKDRRIQKKDAYFQVVLPDRSIVIVEGSRILSRPVERVKGKVGGS
jgi:ribonuclease P protein subunit POP4